MPYKKSYKTNRKNKPKKQFRKKNYKKNNQMVKYNSNWQVTQPQLLIADRQFVKLKYQETNILNTRLTIPAGQAVAIATYRGNDLAFQNNLGSVVTIPGVDAWSRFYARYKVHAIKVRVSLCSNDARTSGESNVPLIGFLHLQSDPTPTTFVTWAQVRQLEGNRYSQFKSLAITQQGGQTVVTNFKRFYQLKYAAGNPKQFLTDAAYEAQLSPIISPPVRLFNYYVGIMSMDGSTVTNDQVVSCMLSTTLYVELKDRIDQVD